MVEIIPTNTCPSDFAELSRRSDFFAAFSPCIQLDVSDGIFVPELSWPYRDGQWAEIEAMAAHNQQLPHSENMTYETHLMVQEPLRIGELLARVGCTRILPHAEVFKDAREIAGPFRPDFKHEHVRIVVR